MKLLWSLFAGMGGLFFAVGLVLVAVDLHFFAGARHTPGEVVDVRYDHEDLGAPDVAYTDDIGRRRVFRSNQFSRPSYRVGDRVTIAYDPKDPERAAIDAWLSRWLGPLIFCGIGGTHLAVGVFGLLRRSRRKREIAWLLREGQRVDATITTVTHDTTLRVNRRHPWVIHCEATLPGEAAPRTFISRRFWYEPQLDKRTLPVCYDPRDPDRHVVDTGDLDPRRAPSRIAQS